MTRARGEIGGDAPLAIPVASRHAHDVAVDVAQMAVGFDLLQPRADVVAGRTFVRQALHRAELLCPRRRAGRRHHRALIPGRQAAERGEVGQLGQPLAQGLEPGHPRQATRRAPIRDPRVMDAAFHGFGPEVFAWFAGLERDNSKAYFTATREHYDTDVRGGLQAMLEELSQTFGGEVKVFRQQRNLRFAPAGSPPYKTRTYGLLHGVHGPAAALYAQLVRAGPVRRHGLSPAGPRPARALPRRRRRRPHRPAARPTSSPRRGPAGSTSSARACAPRRAATRATTRVASCCATRRSSRAARCPARPASAATRRSSTSPRRGARPSRSTPGSTSTSEQAPWKGA